VFHTTAEQYSSIGLTYTLKAVINVAYYRYDTITIDQRVLITQCLDRPIEIALGLVKIGDSWG